MTSSWTRTTLADAVWKRFDFDPTLFWEWLQAHKHLPSDLPENWDPISGLGGALSHVLGPSESAQDIHGVLLRTGDGRSIRPKCKVCGIARVLVGCWLILEREQHEHALAFCKTLTEAAAKIARMRVELRRASRQFGAAQRTRLQAFIAKQERELSVSTLRPSVRRSVRSRLAALRKRPESLGGVDIYERHDVDDALRDAFRRLNLAIDSVQVDLRGLLETNLWKPWAAGREKPLTLVQRILKEEGMSWKEIVEITDEKGDPRSAIDRVRSRVQGRFGKRSR